MLYVCVCNLHIHIGLIPSVVTSVWQHVTRSVSLTQTHTHTSLCLTARHHGCLLGAQVTADRRDRLYRNLSPTPPLPLRRAPEEVSSCRFSAGQAWRWRRLVILGACVFYLPLFEGIGTQRCCLLQVCRCDLQCRHFTYMRTHAQNLTSSSAPKHLEYSTLLYTVLCIIKSDEEFETKITKKCIFSLKSRWV